MKLSKKTSGVSSRLYAKLGWKEQFDRKELEIISSGAVPKLLPPLSVQGRRNNVLVYDISSYSTLEFFMTCILSRDQFVELLRQFIALFRRMQQLYLNYKNLLFEPDKIYININEQSIHMIYLPLLNSKREASIPDFFKMIFSKTNQSTYEQATFVKGCMDWLNQPEPFLLDKFEDFICGNFQNVSQEATNSSKDGGVPSIEENRVSLFEENRRTYHPNSAYSEGARPVEETRNLEEDEGGTTLLTFEPKMHYMLQRENGEIIQLDRFPFLVGQSAGSVNYCVTDNTTVSRRHAKFYIEDGQCLMQDMGSKNKTYINDYELNPYSPYVLRDGDRIRMSNENFIFICEE